MRNVPRFLLPALCALFAMLSADRAAATTAAAGRALAERECARCHTIAGLGKSPLAQAPRFRDIARKYPPSHLAESLAEGIVTGHPAMPVFQFSPDEVAAIIAYLETLRGAGRRK